MATGAGNIDPAAFASGLVAEDVANYASGQSPFNC